MGVWGDIALICDVIEVYIVCVLVCCTRMQTCVHEYILFLCFVFLEYGRRVSVLCVLILYVSFGTIACAASPLCLQWLVVLCNDVSRCFLQYSDLCMMALFWCASY